MSAQRLSSSPAMPPRPLAEGFLVGIGSNIEPETNLPLILNTLLQEFTWLALGQIIETPPLKMNSQRLFLNTVVFVPTPLDERALKEYFNQLEEQLGRDRSDPLSSQKDRPADLDILYHHTLPGHSQSGDLITLDEILPASESYLQQPLTSLLGHLGIQAENASETKEIKSYPTRSLLLGEHMVGETATTIHRDGTAGHKVIA